MHNWYQYRVVDTELMSTSSTSVSQFNIYAVGFMVCRRAQRSTSMVNGCQWTKPRPKLPQPRTRRRHRPWRPATWRPPLNCATLPPSQRWWLRPTVFSTIRSCRWVEGVKGVVRSMIGFPLFDVRMTRCHSVLISNCIFIRNRTANYTVQQN